MLSGFVATLAPIVNCFQLFPQLYKIYTTKSVKDLSFHTIVLILITNTLWLLHGYFIVDYSLIIAGIISITVNITLLILYLRYRPKLYGLNKKSM